MRHFTTKQLLAAYAHAQSGGQALHLHPLTAGHPYFRRYPEAGHLFDQNLERLILTAKRLGVRIVKVEHLGTHKQHVDLCGQPLARAKALAEGTTQ
jgi:hypothetical protein